MEAVVKEWKDKKSEFEKNNLSQEDPPWYKKPIGIIGIFAAVAVIGGVIYYLVKQNVSKKRIS